MIEAPKEMMDVARFARRLILRHYPEAVYVHGTPHIARFEILCHGEILGRGKSKLEALIDAASKIRIPVSLEK